MKRLEVDTQRGVGRPLVLVAFVVAALRLTPAFLLPGAQGPLHASRSAVTSLYTPTGTPGATQPQTLRLRPGTSRTVHPGPALALSPQKYWP